MNTEGVVLANDEDDPKYAAIGKDLIDCGLAQITEREFLIYDSTKGIIEVYDVHTFAWPISMAEYGQIAFSVGNMSKSIDGL